MISRMPATLKSDVDVGQHAFYAGKSDRTEFTLGNQRPFNSVHPVNAEVESQFHQVLEHRVEQGVCDDCVGWRIPVAPSIGATQAECLDKVHLWICISGRLARLHEAPIHRVKAQSTEG